MNGLLVAEEWLDVFPALDNSTRFNILIYLSNEGSKSVTDVCEAFNLQQSSTHHHLAKLLDVRLIDNSYQTPKVSTEPSSFYSITERGKKILELLLTNNNLS